ncbi:adenylate kinase 8 [Aplochiton taeniatus]
MDETMKPLRIPPEMAIYAEKHEIFDLVQNLVTNLMVDKPNDPILYLIGLLKRCTVEVPRIMLLGPPASGKRSIARKLCESLHAIHITDTNLLQEDTELTKTALEYRDRGEEIPGEVWVSMIQQRLAKIDCFRRGWLLEGFPRTRREALGLQEAGIAPEHVVMLEAPDSVLLERGVGKRVDPLTGDVYHLTFVWPTNQEVQQRLELPSGRSLSEEQRLAELYQYRREVHALQRTYPSMLKTFDADQPHTDVYDQVLNYILSLQRTMAPHTPRILLFGPPGSGKSLMAKLISQKYNIVNVCCGELLKSVSVDATSMGELIKPYLETGQRVPDSMVIQILTDRLSRVDCTTRGWVLHGFPRDLEQAERLQETNFIPSRVFFLEMTDDVAIERITQRAVDPVSGERYHSLYKPAPSAEIQNRLVFNPADSEPVLQQKLREYWATAATLQGLYRDAAHINADQDPHTVFESLESRLVGRLVRTQGKPHISD